MNFLTLLLEAAPSASALGNHLLQSTLFAGLCWLAARLLKRQRASTRYAIWLAASVKFLLPFSILVGIGGYAGEFTDLRVVPEEWFVAPRGDANALAVHGPAPQIAQQPSTRTSGFESAQRVLIVLWLGGAAFVAVWGVVRWRNLAVRIGKPSLLSEGRAVDAL